jgi:hypothetical protein
MSVAKIVLRQVSSRAPKERARRPGEHENDHHIAQEIEHRGGGYVADVPGAARSASVCGAALPVK